MTGIGTVFLLLALLTVVVCGLGTLVVRSAFAWSRRRPQQPTKTLLVTAVAAPWFVVYAAGLYLIARHFL